MANEEEVRQEVYYIPENFEDAGGVLGGHFTQRNAIELMVLCGPLAFVEAKFLSFSIQTNIIIMMFTLIPLAALCAFGIGGESLSQILVAYIRFTRKRRKLSYYEFTEEAAGNAHRALGFDGLLDAITSKGLKGAMLEMKAAKEKAAAEEVQEEEEEEEAVVEPGKKRKKSKSTKKAKASKSGKSAAPRAPVHRKKTSASSGAKGGMMNSALKEKLLKKLELGDDEDY